VKIAFFSKEGSCGATSSLAAISIAAVLSKKLRILTLENHWSESTIAECYFYENSTNIVRQGCVRYLEHGMLDNLVKHFAVMTNKRREGIMTVEVIEDSLYYMPQNAFSHDLFDYEFSCNMLPMLKILETSYPFLFIDTKNQTMSSKIILEEADFVVVQLPQNELLIEEIMKSYSTILNKSLFLISDYREHSSISIPHIMNEYQILPERLAILPHSVPFETAISEGSAINFIYSNYNCDESHVNYAFMKELKRTTELILCGTQLRECAIGGNKNEAKTNCYAF
jgi:hypothetical protein